MMYERWIDREDRLNYRATIIAAFVANAAPGKSRRAVQPHDIIGPLRARAETQQINSLEDQVAAIKMLFGADAIETEVIPAEDE